MNPKPLDLNRKTLTSRMSTELQVRDILGHMEALVVLQGLANTLITP